MKTVTKMDAIKDQERGTINQQHQERLQQFSGMIKQDGRYLKRLNVMVSADDLTAFRRYREEVLDGGSRRLTGMEIIYDMFLNRHQLEELIVTESRNLTPLEVRIDTELYETLKEEAGRYKITLNDYIRSILYGLGQAAYQRRMDNIQMSLDSNRHQRSIQVPFFISPEQREHMYKKHGSMTDDQLVKLAQQLFRDVLLK